jgi:hypothetical protein
MKYRIAINYISEANHVSDVKLKYKQDFELINKYHQEKIMKMDKNEAIKWMLRVLQYKGTNNRIKETIHRTMNYFFTREHDKVDLNEYANKILKLAYQNNHTDVIKMFVDHDTDAIHTNVIHTDDSGD